jgi:DNA-binding NarL/FixJ family response regulator
MSYQKAELVLPQELLALVQEYAQGQYLYIPKKAENYKEWGENTDTKRQIRQRDREIYRKYCSGHSASVLAEEYYLSVKSIHRILLKEKKNA